MLNVFEMYASLGLDSSNYENGLKNAENNTNNLSATTVAVGNIMADAFEAVISKVGEFASSVIEAGAQEETALKKVQTIMDSSVVSTEDMNGAIKDLSNEMGISVASLSDSVYNAISATGDTAGAVDLVAQASKLATGGFTETESALSVLTTAMNAYGDSAGSVEHISDSLMTVQNRGVTTVGELASSMGKAIASASAYGVNLENLESAYISITKAGINTAEGTTYISSMLKELGSDGSKVSEIIKEQTGKSFADLMNEGASLGDVLQILSDSVDGDSTALMNLWSSAEAGKATSAIVGQGIDYFNESLNELQTTVGATESAYETMSDTFEHRQAIMDTKIENMKATLFDKFEPLLFKLFDWLDTKAMPFLDTVIDNIDLIAPIILGVVSALGVLTVALNIGSIIQGVTTAFTMLNTVLLANPIGIVVALIAGLVIAITTLWKTNDNFRNAVINAWNTIKTHATNVINGIKNVFSSIAQVGSNMVQGLWNGISSGWTWLTDKVKNLASNLISEVKNVLGVHSPSTVFASIGGFLAEGLGEGWSDEMANVQKNIEGDLDFSATPITTDGFGSGNASTNSIMAEILEKLDAMANLNIVLDTGALVGQTVQAYDSALGKRYTNEVRYV